MSSESLAVLIDNSPYSRNSEILPNLLETQKDVVGPMCDKCISSSMENSTILISYGSRPKQLCSNSKSPHQIYTTLQALQHERQAAFNQVDIISALQIAILSLRRRENKDTKPRIALFCCSSLESEYASLEKIRKTARMLKKEDISIDIYSFGRYSQLNERILLEIVKEANKSVNGFDTCSYYLIPSGFSSLRSGIETIMRQQGRVQKSPTFRQDDEDDKLMQEVLRMSMQDYYAGQQQQQQQSNDNSDETKETKETKEESDTKSETQGFTFNDQQ